MRRRQSVVTGGPTRMAAVGSLLLAWPVGCGYVATPVQFELSATTADTFEIKLLNTRGTLDPAASEFDDGVLLSTRWEVEREGSRVTELWLDLRRSALPEVLTAGEPPVALLATEQQVRATLTHRGGDGKIVLRQTPTYAQVVLTAWRAEGNRELVAGSFTLELPGEAGALYVELGGLFETVPRPQGRSVLGGDWGQPDAGAADPAPVDPTSDPTPVDPAADLDAPVVYDDSGCSCPGGGEEEELPSEEEPQGDGEDSGGCDCQGDDGGEPGDPDGGDASDGGGCDCQGDDGGEPGDPDGGDEAGSGGCDCQGDEDPDPTDARLLRHQPTHQLAAAKPRRLRRPKCERATGRLWWAISPFVVFWWLGARQRRRD